MTCVHVAPGVVVCRPSNQWLRRRVIRCSFCQCMREMVVRHEPWYGDSYMCTGCGDSWQDGELCPRPFARGWRQRAVKRYRELWAIATYGEFPMEEIYGEVF